MVALHHDIFIKIPKWFAGSKSDEYCWKLGTCLYGLKQSEVEWQKLCKKILTDKGFIQSKTDTAMYYKRY